MQVGRYRLPNYTPVVFLWVLVGYFSYVQSTVGERRIVVWKDSFETSFLWQNFSSGCVLQSNYPVRTGSYALRKFCSSDPSGGYLLLPYSIKGGFVLKGYIWRDSPIVGGGNDRLSMLNSSFAGIGMSISGSSYGFDIRSAPGATATQLPSLLHTRPVNAWYAFEWSYSFYNNVLNLTLPHVAYGSNVYTPAPLGPPWDRLSVQGGYAYNVDDLELSVLCRTFEFANASTSWTCQPCREGFEPLPNGTSCSYCPAGWYSNVSTNFVCAPCPANHGNNGERSACIECSETQRVDSINSGMCICQADWYGPSCLVTCQPLLNCSSHGTCSPMNGSCLCDTNYYGIDCSTYCNATTTCSGHGSCNGVTGTCVCDTDYYGTNCSTHCIAPTTCSGHGVCSPTTGECLCFPDYAFSTNCSVFCHNETTCSSHGTCSDSGSCMCAPNYYSPSCNVFCNNSDTCTGHGVCTAFGNCSCHLNYYNTSCGTYCDAITTCTGHGVCTADGTCQCVANYFGSDCSTYCNPVSTCSGHGSCSATTGACVCNAGYNFLANCSLYCNSVTTCSSHGSCSTNGTCSCSANYYTPFCNVFCNASSTCSAHGLCDPALGTCVCDFGYYGSNCASYCNASATCSNHGTCNAYNGSCICDTDYYHSNCSRFCNRLFNCSNHGSCSPDGKRCSCDLTFYGPSCEKYCDDLSTCSGNGQCTQHGDCSCQAGYYTPSCNRFCNASSSCSGHGSCSPLSGNCQCDQDFYGVDCSTYCTGAVCNDRGKCSKSGKCLCNTGFSGPTCNIRVASPEPPAGGVADAVTSESSQDTVTVTTAASAASGSSFLQLFDSLQCIIRLAMLDVRYALWYVEFVQGFGVAMLNFQMPFLQPLFSSGILEDPSDPEVDKTFDSNLRLYSMDTMGSYSAHFIIFFVSLTTIYILVFLVIFSFYSGFYLFYRFWVYICYRRVPRHKIPGGVLRPYIFHRFLVFLRGIIFTLFYASTYPLFVAIGLQLTVGRHVRPVGETLLAIGSIIAYFVMLWFWVVPFIRRRSPSQFPKFERAVNSMVFDFPAHLWWVHIAQLVVFIVDALVVVAGAEIGLTAETQLCLVLLFSAIRFVYFFVVQPCTERTKQWLQTFTFAADVIQLLLIYSLIGHHRTSQTGEKIVFILSIIQMCVVAVNLVASIVETAVKVMVVFTTLGRILMLTIMQRLRSRPAARSQQLTPAAWKPGELRDVSRRSTAELVAMKHMLNLGAIRLFHYPSSQRTRADSDSVLPDVLPPDRSAFHAAISPAGAGGRATKRAKRIVAQSGSR